MAREQAVVLGPTRFPGLPYEKKVFWDMDRTLFQALENYQAMVKAGVKTGMGTDSGPNGRFPGFNAHEEMQLQVLAGRTPDGRHQVRHQRQCRMAGGQDHRQHRERQVGRSCWCWTRIRWTTSATPRPSRRSISPGNSVPTIWTTCRDRAESECQKRPADLPSMPY